MPPSSAKTDWHESYLQMQQRYLAAQTELRKKEELWKLQKVEFAKQQQQAGHGGAVLRPASGNIGQPAGDGSVHTTTHQRPKSAPVGTSSSSRSKKAHRADRENTATAPYAVHPQQQHQPHLLPSDRQQQQWNSAASPHGIVNSSQVLVVDASHATQAYPPGGGGGPLPSQYTGSGGAPDPYAAVNVASPVYAPYGLEHGGAHHGSHPGSSMVWGLDTTANAVSIEQCQALLRVNEQLRQRVAVLEEVASKAQQDAALVRQAMDNTARKEQQVQSELLHAVQQRDGAVQRCQAAEAAQSAIQEQLRQFVAQNDVIRADLDMQLRDMRSKLFIAADLNDSLTGESRRSNSEAKELSVMVAGLQARLSLSESSLLSQKQVNEALLTELKSLGDQLAQERRKFLNTSRDLQDAAAARDRASQLQSTVEQLRSDHRSAEQANMQLLTELAQCHELAHQHARNVVQEELESAAQRAAHWETTSRLQFRDTQLRAAEHMQCRKELEREKEVRDDLERQLTDVKTACLIMEAKLDLVWPSHAQDTHGLNAESIRESYGRSPRRADRGGTGTSFSLEPFGSLEEQVAELREAFAVVNAEKESLALANDVLRQRVSDATAASSETQATFAKELKRAALRNAAVQERLASQTDRAAVLDRQLRACRGETILDHSLPFDSVLGADEVVIEVFLGQVVTRAGPASITDGGIARSAATWLAAGNHSSSSRSAGAPGGPVAVPADAAFVSVFATVDFLVHETAVSQPVTVGPSGNFFFDATFLFRVRADALLAHCFMSRGLVVSLRRMLGAGEDDQPSDQGSKVEPTATGNDVRHALLASGRFDLSEFILNSAFLRATRPSLRGHLSIGNRSSPAPSCGGDIAALEIAVTARTPFPPPFAQLIEATYANDIAEWSQRRALAAIGGEGGPVCTTTTLNDTLDAAAGRRQPPQAAGAISGSARQRHGGLGGEGPVDFSNSSILSSMNSSEVTGRTPPRDAAGPGVDEDAPLSRGSLLHAVARSAHMGPLPAASFSSSSATLGGGLWQRLQRVAAVVIRIDRIVIDIRGSNEGRPAVAPTLSLWYSGPASNANSADTWVLPLPGQQALFDTCFQHQRRFDLGTTAGNNLETLATFLATPLTFVAFSDDDDGANASSDPSASASSASVASTAVKGCWAFASVEVMALLHVSAEAGAASTRSANTGGAHMDLVVPLLSPENDRAGRAAPRATVYGSIDLVV